MFKYENSNIYFDGKIWTPWVYQNFTKEMKKELVNQLNITYLGIYDKGFRRGIDMSLEAIQELADG